jgi:ATP-dependent DNA ligase
MTSPFLQRPAPSRCFNADRNYLIGMVKTAFEPCLPTVGKQVASRADWIHEIKHDGYRLIVQREGKRARLFTRNGHDWTNRYPLIVEAALKNRISSFVVDGEAVLLGVDGISDFNGLHSSKHDYEVQLYAFDILSHEGDDLRPLPLHLRKTNLARPPGAGRRASSSPTSSAARSALIYSARPASSASRAWSPNTAIAPTAPAVRRTGSRSRTARIRRSAASRNRSDEIV